MTENRDRSHYLLDVVGAVATMAQEVAALRARVAVLETANADLMRDWQEATTRLHEAQECALAQEEARPVLVNDEHP